MEQEFDPVLEGVAIYDPMPVVKTAATIALGIFGGAVLVGAARMIGKTAYEKFSSKVAPVTE